MKRTLFTLIAALIVAAGLLTGLPRAHAQRGVAFPHALSWFNVSRPLAWTDLRGRAVLLDFFTPGCINCIHMLPAEKQLEERFGTRLVVIGIDSPKFSASKTRQGLESFIQRYDLRHPTVLDPDMSLWQAYGVQAWPTLILVGPDGSVRQTFIGEQSLEQLAGPVEAALKGAPPASKLPGCRCARWRSNQAASRRPLALRYRPRKLRLRTPATTGSCWPIIPASCRPSSAAAVRAMPTAITRTPNSIDRTDSCSMTARYISPTPTTRRSDASILANARSPRLPATGSADSPSGAAFPHVRRC